MKLANQVAVVAGASMGIGEAIADLFAEQGASVVLSSRDLGRCEAARQRIACTDRTLAIACDVRDAAQVRSLVDSVVARYGRIDLWINNAGFGMLDFSDVMDMTDCRSLLDTNFFGAVQAFQAVVPIMKRQGSGTVVNISSVAGYIPLPYGTAYCASKRALNAFSYIARMELRGTGINVLNVCPGFVATQFQRSVVRGEAFRNAAPPPRGVAPERVARAVLRGILKRKREVVVPWFYRPMIALYKRWPSLIDALVAAKLHRTSPSQ